MGRLQLVNKVAANLAARFVCGCDGIRQRAPSFGSFRRIPQLRQLQLISHMGMGWRQLEAKSTFEQPSSPRLAGDGLRLREGTHRDVRREWRNRPVE